VLAFIDESGDLGFRIDQGASQHFVLAMIIFENKEEAIKAEDIIKKLLVDTKVKPEFKFNKTRADIKDTFFMAIRKCKFKVRALVVDKKKIYNFAMRGKKEVFYSYLMRLLLHHDNNSLKNALVKIDGSEDKIFRRKLTAYLRANVGSGKLNNIRFCDSKRNLLIQLADMVAGAIARSYKEGHKANGKWIKMLEEKVDNIWEFK
jgi:hypothetical protein